MELKTDDRNFGQSEVANQEEQKPKRGPGRPRKKSRVQSDSAVLEAGKKSEEQIGGEGGEIGRVGEEHEPSFEPVLGESDSDSVAEPVSPKPELEQDPKVAEKVIVDSESDKEAADSALNLNLNPDWAPVVDEASPKESSILGATADTNSERLHESALLPAPVDVGEKSSNESVGTKELSMSGTVSGQGEAQASSTHQKSQQKELGAKQSTQIHLIDGEKGGVGKSLFARVLVQFFQENLIPFVAIDTDRSNESLFGFYPDIKKATFSEDENLLDKADDVYNFALEQSVIVDLPAQAFRPVKNWIEKNNLLALAQDDDITFYKWFVCDGGYDSLNLLKQSLEELEDAIGHVLVKNLGKCEDWTHLDKDETWQNLLASKNVKTIHFPKFYHMERNRIDMKRLTWNDALAQTNNPAGFHSISRSRIKSFLREAHAEIARLKLFGGTL